MGAEPPLKSARLGKAALKLQLGWLNSAEDLPLWFQLLHSYRSSLICTALNGCCQYIACKSLQLAYWNVTSILLVTHGRCYKLLMIFVFFPVFLVHSQYYSGYPHWTKKKIAHCYSSKVSLSCLLYLLDALGNIHYLCFCTISSPICCAWIFPILGQNMPSSISCLRYMAWYFDFHFPPLKSGYKFPNKQLLSGICHCSISLKSIFVIIA